MKSNYDFSQAIRGKYARRYAQGANVVILEARCRQSVPYFEGSEFFSAKDHSAASLGTGPVTIATSGEFRTSRKLRPVPNPIRPDN